MKTKWTDEQIRWRKKTWQSEIQTVDNIKSGNKNTLSKLDQMNKVDEEKNYHKANNKLYLLYLELIIRKWKTNDTNGNKMDKWTNEMKEKNMKKPKRNCKWDTKKWTWYSCMINFDHILYNNGS